MVAVGSELVVVGCAVIVVGSVVVLVVLGSVVVGWFCGNSCCFKCNSCSI